MHALRQVTLLLQLTLRLTWSPLFARRPIEIALPAVLVTSIVGTSLLLFAPTVRVFCNAAGLSGMLVVNAVVTHGFFGLIVLWGGEFYFANFARLVRWPVSCRQIAWGSIISVSVDPRILLFVGPLFGVGVALLEKSVATFLIGGLAMVLSVGTACAAILAVAGVLQQLRGPYASTIKGLILAVAVAFALHHLQQNREAQLMLSERGRKLDLSCVGTSLPLTCLPARAVDAYAKGAFGVACLLFTGAGLVVFILAETAACLGARSATQR